MDLQRYIGIRFMVLINKYNSMFTFWREIYLVFVKYNE